MEAQLEATHSTNVSFVVVDNGAMCVPVLVERTSFIGKLGDAAQGPIQTAYVPKAFPSARKITSEDPL